MFSDDFGNHFVRTHCGRSVVPNQAAMPWGSRYWHPLVALKKRKKGNILVSAWTRTCQFRLGDNRTAYLPPAPLAGGLYKPGGLPSSNHRFVFGHLSRERGGGGEERKEEIYPLRLLLHQEFV